MQRLSTWSLVIVAIAVFVAAGLVVAKSDPVPHAGKALLPPSTSTPRTSPSATSTGVADRRSIAFLGDDWTAGVGASSPARRFSTLVAHALGLQQHNIGADGTGYAKASDSGGRYLTRVSAVVRADPDVVVVSGGRNDVSDDVDTLANSISTLFTTLRHRLPGATIIAVAPMWGDSDKPSTLAPVAAAVRSAAQAAGGHYLAVADPIHGHPKDMSDGADPDDAGYAAIAAALTPKIRGLLPA